MHQHAHGHTHGVRSMSNRRLLAVSLCLTAVVMVVQIVGSILSGSLALLADAAHMFTDASGLVVALVASVVAARPADDRRTFGYQRAEVLGALVNGVILLVLAVLVAAEGIGRLLRPASTEIVAPIMLLVAVVGLIANACALWLLSRAQKSSINVRGAYLEVLGDLIGSAAVIVAALVILWTGWMPADAVASLLIAALILPRAFSLLREVFSVLAESAPKSVHVGEIRQHVAALEGVVSVHDVHVWQLTRGAPVFSAHVGVDARIFAEGRTAELLEALQECLSAHFDVAHSTFQLEPANRTACDESHA